MSSPDLVSIIIPAFNAAHFLRETIDSVLAQSHPNTEIIVIDDGSTDDTAAVAQSYGSAINLIRQKNRGSGAACNTGAQAARGRWLAFIDADDIWRHDKLSLQLEHCSGSALSYTDMLYFGEVMEKELLRSSFSRPRTGYVLRDLLIENFIPKSSVLVLRDAFLEVKGFPADYHAVEDWPLWLRICAKHEIAYLAEPTLKYRVHRKSKSMSARRTMKDHVIILRDAFAPGGPGSVHRDLRRPAMAMSYRINSHYAAESGDWSFALYCAARSLLIEPADINTWKRLIKAGLMPVGVPY